MAKNNRTKLTPRDCWVVVSAHNEARHIADVVRRIQRQGFPHVIVADDGSQDRTARTAKAAGALVVSHTVNLGKGAAMKSGADYAVAHHARAIIFLDGDGQHKPEELPHFVRELNNGYAIVFGYRKRTGNMPFVRRLGGWFLSTFIRIVYNMDLKDVLSGYRAMTTAAYRTVRWNARDYSVESEMIARAGKACLRYTQFEITTIYIDSWKGMSILDGIPIAFKLLWWRMTH
jgi:glycosyltransferase involved in cell wall biosynthesis